MKIKYKCPHCGIELAFDDTLCGQRVICGSCRQAFVVQSRQAPRNSVLGFVLRKKHKKERLQEGIVTSELEVLCPQCNTGYYAQRGDFGKNIGVKVVT